MSAKQLLPLSGIASVALIFVAFAIVGEPPDLGSDEEIRSFYTDKQDDLTLGAALLALGSFFFLVFSTAVVNLIRGVRGASSSSANLTLAGGIVFAVGVTIFAGIAFSAAEAAGDVGIESLRTFQALEMNLFFPLAVGVAAFLFGAGFGTVKTAALPAWLSWAAMALGVLAITPVGFFAFLGLGIWTLIVSVILALRARAAPMPGVD
jgi:hypothetical protein